MLRFSHGVVGKFCFLLLLFSLVANFTWAQSETATVSGQVVDPSGLNVTGAQVKLVDIDRDTSTDATTNNSGLYMFPSVRPGRYRMAVTAAGFKVVNVTGVTVNVQDHLEQNFKLLVGSVSESITVEGGVPLVDTESATVSTVVDRNFAENLPMNGRSFQTLIQLTPGVVVTTSNPQDGGQFSVDGQRAASNYWMVDGVSANIGIGTNPGNYPSNGLAGAAGSFSVLGGTNSLVSVDALQEFRIQTSTYAPEFGRTPGGQISVVTRSGTNQFHGTVFDYLRNDVFDANDWFNGYINTPPLPKAKERQNDFGGTFSGPIVKDRTFFFFSYEGLRLRLPQTTLSTVPDLLARKNTASAMRPYVNAYPLPNGADNMATGAAAFNASYSDPASLNAYSLRIDHRFSNKWNVFGRYNYSPSNLIQRGASIFTLNTLNHAQITTQTATLGATWAIFPEMTDDLRFNYSRTNASSYNNMDDFGGAVALMSLPFPSSFTSQNALFGFSIIPLQQRGLSIGQNGRNLQRQINIVDSLSVRKGPHSFKFGVDFRRLSPIFAPEKYAQSIFVSSLLSAESGTLLFGSVGSDLGPTFLFRNLGIYAQDNWRVVSRLTLTYGIRWDVDCAPQSNPSFPAVTGFDLDDLSNLALAPAGTRPYQTTYDNFAPRLGVAIQLSQSQDWQAVIRGGFGMFYDLATSEMGNQVFPGNYPFGGSTLIFGGTFPLSPLAASPPPITPPSGSNSQILTAFDPHLQLPYTLEWNVAFEQALGRRQTVSASYIGAAGSRLLQSAEISKPNPTIGSLSLVTNAGTSNYNAFQAQFQRRLSHGLQALASYTWAHSIDTGSAGSGAVTSNALVPSAIAGSNRGPSDFDIRNAFSTGLTYDVPSPKRNVFANAILRGWSTENVIIARSAPPIFVSEANIFGSFTGGFSGDIRPDIIAGQALYIYGPECLQAPPVGFGQPCPGGKGINPNAFANPPVDPNTGNALRQGTTPRNFLRGFGATQWDSGVHHDFPIRQWLKLRIRAEVFNVLNHPNFGPPNGQFGTGGFGLSTQLLGQSLNNGNLGGGAFDPLYQIGGPRSMQLALKLEY